MKMKFALKDGVEPVAVHKVVINEDREPPTAFPTEAEMLAKFRQDPKEFAEMFDNLLANSRMEITVHDYTGKLDGGLFDAD